MSISYKFSYIKEEIEDLPINNTGGQICITELIKY